jgi:hypothetical protein
MHMLHHRYKEEAESCIQNRLLSAAMVRLGRKKTEIDPKPIFQNSAVKQSYKMITSIKLSMIMLGMVHTDSDPSAYRLLFDTTRLFGPRNECLATLMKR